MDFSTKLLTLLMLGTFTFLTSCGDEETTDLNQETNVLLEGNWDVTSLTEDGVETIGYEYTSWKMDFSKETPQGGEVEMTIIFTDGTTDQGDADYSIRNEGRQISIDGDEMRIKVDGDELTLTGNMDGTRVELEADRI
jgi:hypothetical protein